MALNQINPSTPFTVSFYIPVNTDVNLYYVQAIIYDALTGEILATENLDRQTTNTRLYSKRVQSPGDASSTGRLIVVAATAYTDSGYTSKSPDYQDQAETYLVKATPSVLGGGGGGFGIDYVKVREIVEDVIDKKQPKKPEKAEKEPEPIKPPEMRWDAVLGAIGALQREINRIPKDATDVSPVLSGLDNLKQAIADKEVTEKTDIEPLMAKIDDLETRLEANQMENKEALTEAVDEMKRNFTQIMPMLKEIIESSEFTLNFPKPVTAKAEVPDQDQGDESVESPIRIEDLIPKNL
jgi:hypothetical protein